jgi:hypothetical protein
MDDRRPSTVAAARLGVGAAAVPSAADAAALRRRGAFFSLFSLPSPSSPTTGVTLTPFTPQLFSGFAVNEGLHRFEVAELPPHPDCGLRVEQRYDPEVVARVAMRMTPMPNNYQPGLDRLAWPTVLLPFISQRFVPLDGSFAFVDRAASGFGAAGAGRVVPTGGGLRPTLAAVLEPLSPSGRLAGLHGVGVVNGDIAPPAGFAFNVLFRFDDPEGRLAATAPPGPLSAASDPTPDTSDGPGSTFLPLLSEPAPGQRLDITRAADGEHVEVRIVERLRLVSLAFDVTPPGLRSAIRPGPVVGDHRSTLVVDPRAGGDVLPAYSRDDAFDFFDQRGRGIGGFAADTLEARVILPPAGRGTVLGIGGFAAPRRGYGQFRSPAGMVSINGAVDPASGAMSTLYLVRLMAPDAQFKVVARRPAVAAAR